MRETAPVVVINIAKVMRVQLLILQLSKQEAGEWGNTLYTTSRESLMGGIHTITSISAQLSFIPSTHQILVLWRAFEWAFYASRGRILGRNSDKSLKSFPPCYSESSLQLYLETFFSNSRNLFHFLQLTGNGNIKKLFYGVQRNIT